MLGGTLYTENDAARRVGATSKQSESYRSPWSRDQSRLLHSASFRRLCGKTQLFPAGESDFFRNRLTHSLEVSKIARTIAHKLNVTVEDFKADPIDLDLVEFACMAHDLGHPPFGHIGERALNRVMKEYGGFEGNAQTFRILSRLEKREMLPEGQDRRCGLNLTARSLASTIKKHNLIGLLSEKVAQGKIDKGIYNDDLPAYQFVLDHVYGDWSKSPCVVIESAIMDVSDDIAYATYDFEDILKSGFFSPIDMASLPPDQLDKVCEKVTAAVREWYPDACDFTPTDYALVVGDILKESSFDISPEVIDAFRQSDTDDKTFRAALAIAGDLNSMSRNIAGKTSFRTALTSNLVELFVNSIEWVPSEEGRPLSLSSVRLPLDVLRIVETLKHLAFALVIKSTNVALSEQKGSFIVESLADTLMNKPFGYELLPADIKEVFDSAEDKTGRARSVCDFIAGMTDQYAMELHSRMIGAKNTSIFVPI